MKKKMVFCLVLVLSAMLSFSFNEVNAGGTIYGPGFYFEGGDGNGEPDNEDIELIATGFTREISHYDQNGDQIIGPYDNGSVTPNLQMELYLPLSDIDDQFADVDNVTQFYAKFTNSDLNYYNNTFYKVIYVYDYYQIPADADDMYFTSIDLIYNYHETMSAFESSEVDNAVDVTDSYEVFNILSSSTVRINGQYLGVKTVYRQVHTSTILIPINDPIGSGNNFMGGYYIVNIDPNAFDYLSWSVININDGDINVDSITYYSTWTSSFLDDLILMDIG